MGPDDFTLFEMRQAEDVDGVVRLSLLGELDLVGVEWLEARLHDLRATAAAVRLDLSQLEFIDSSGLRALITSAQVARRDGWRLEFDRRLLPPVGRVIELIGASRYLWPPGEPVGQD
jgi:anti-anti-sigma factor